ncbi:MAG: hypothetical protein ACPIOQ_66845, partial [Promethearchaeia archaeon]
HSLEANRYQFVQGRARRVSIANNESLPGTEKPRETGKLGLIRVHESRHGANGWIRTLLWQLRLAV